MELIRLSERNKNNRKAGYYRCPVCEEEIFLTRDKGPLSKTCKSCRGTQNQTHGMSKHPAFSVWQQLIQRCINPKNPRYHCYGARGITVCEDWQTFEGFWADNKDRYKPGLTIDRTDGDKNYDLGNTEWITHAANSAKTNRMRAVIRTTYNDQGQAVKSEYPTLREAVRQTGTPLNTINRNIRSGRANRKGELWQYADQPATV